MSVLTFAFKCRHILYRTKEKHRTVFVVVVKALLENAKQISPRADLWPFLRASSHAVSRGLVLISKWKTCSWYQLSGDIVCFEAQFRI